MAYLENIRIHNYLVGLRISHWINRCVNCTFWQCGLSIQLSGGWQTNIGPFVANDTISNPQSSPLTADCKVADVNIVSVSPATSENPLKVTLSAGQGASISVGQVIWSNSNSKRWLVFNVDGDVLSLDNIEWWQDNPSTGAAVICGGIYFPGQYLWSDSMSKKWLISAVNGPTLSLIDVDYNLGTPSAGPGEIRYEAGATGDSAYATNATILGCFVVRSVHYGIIVNGQQNAIIHSAIEWPFWNKGNQSAGIFVAKGSEATSITSCYFERNNRHIVLEGASDLEGDPGPAKGTKIIGNFVVYHPEGLYKEKWIDYGTNTAAPGAGNSDFETTRRVFDNGNRSFDFRSSLSGPLGIGTVNPPWGMLDVARNWDGISWVASQLLLRGEGGNSGKILSIGYDTSNGRGVIQAGTDGVGYDDLVLNNQGGKIGIGQVSPKSGLHISANAGGSNKGYITLEKLGTDPGSAPGTGKAIIYLSSTGKLKAWVENAASPVDLA
jgi:hypothetical protein